MQRKASPQAIIALGVWTARNEDGTHYWTRYGWTQCPRRYAALMPLDTPPDHPLHWEGGPVAKQWHPAIAGEHLGLDPWECWEC